MIKYTSWFILIGMLTFGKITFAQSPKLVVGIIVDQMRMEYLERYKSHYGNDGFKRFVHEGFVFQNAHYNYIPTVTGPGHASVYTGTTPSRHGIIANNWYNKNSGLFVYCAQDTSATAVGGSAQNGKISAVNLKSTTITDELRMFYNDRSKVVAISIKDRGAALPAGHHPNGAYWFDNKTGNFMTSSYYMKQLPNWVEDFNKKAIAKQYAKETWKPLLPLSAYQESLPDDNPYENLFAGNKTPTFPYKLEGKNGLDLLATTPFGNTLVIDFAIAAINAEQLGSDQIPDMLAISFSSPDYAGHAFGPRAVEIQDMYIRLDQDLAKLFKFLDEKVGKNEYIVFLTADHAVAEVPQYSIDYQYPGGYFNRKETEKQLNKVLIDSFGEGEWIINISNEQVFFNHQTLASKNKTIDEVSSVVIEWLLQLPEVAEVISAKTLRDRNATDPLIQKLQNGYNSKLSGDVLFILQPGYFEGSYGRKGTTHGAGYNYDTHVPIFFYGKNIPTGKSVRPVTITDIAPTLSMLLSIPLPSASSDKPLMELFK